MYSYWVKNLVWSADSSISEFRPTPFFFSKPSVKGRATPSFVFFRFVSKPVSSYFVFLWDGSSPWWITAWSVLSKKKTKNDFEKQKQKHKQNLKLYLIVSGFFTVLAFEVLFRVLYCAMLANPSSVLLKEKKNTQMSLRTKKTGNFRSLQTFLIFDTNAVYLVLHFPRW